jgi:hypothetical protein
MRGGFFDDEFQGKNPVGGFGPFFGGIGGDFPFERDRDDDDNIGNFSHHVSFHITPNGFSQDSPNYHDNEYQNSLNNGFNNSINEYNNYNQNNQFNKQNIQNEPQKEIKFRDSKIYDV